MFAEKLIIASNKGKEKEIVYNNKYMVAVVRSGWYPQHMIRRAVGIRDSSNII